MAKGFDTKEPEAAIAPKIPDPDSIVVRDRAYAVMPFTYNHLQTLGRMLELKDGVWGVGSFRGQCEAAEIAKEVIVPDLIADVISITPSGKYVWMLERDEIAAFTLRLVQIFYQRQLAKSNGDKQVEEELKRQIAEYQELLDGKPAPQFEVSEQSGV